MCQRLQEVGGHPLSRTHLFDQDEVTSNLIQQSRSHSHFSFQEPEERVLDGSAGPLHLLQLPWQGGQHLLHSGLKADQPKGLRVLFLIVSNANSLVASPLNQHDVRKQLGCLPLSDDLLYIQWKTTPNWAFT